LSLPFPAQGCNKDYKKVKLNSTLIIIIIIIITTAFYT
jgi:hypothetical protein